MSDLTPRSGRRLSRREREQRAYRLVLATGASGVATAVALVLSIVGVTSFGLAVLLALLTAALAYGLKRSVGR